MPPQTTDALVLRTYPIGEQSKVVVLFTRTRGKVRGVAKGVRVNRNRYQSALEPLSEVRVGLYGRENATLLRLGTVDLVRSAVPKTPTLAGLVAIEYCAELIEKLTPDAEPELATWRLGRALVSALLPLSAERDAFECEARAIAVVRYAEAWSLRLHGLYPSLSRCANCRRAIGGALVYDPATETVVCAACRKGRPEILDADSRALLRSALRLSPANFAERVAHIDLDPIARYHAFLLDRHLGRSLNSARVLASLGAPAPPRGEAR